MCDHHHPPRFSRRRLFASLIPGAILAQQPQPQTVEQTAALFRQRSADFEKRGLTDPFKGITANGEVERGLFPVFSTGVPTTTVREAAVRFLGTLSAEQKQRTMFEVDDPEWRKWMNQHFYRRQGVSLKELNGGQRDAAFGLLQAALSPRGVKLTRDIMRLNEVLADLSGDHDFLGEWEYHITVMGKPSQVEPWGFQFDGHHCIINYFILGDQVVMTPYFVGSEPVTARGISILQEEQNRGLAMLLALDKGQQAKAVLNPAKTDNYNLTEAFKDNVVLDYAGLRADAMSAKQKKQLLDLILLYVGNMDDGHAKVKMQEVRKHLDNTYFAWIGGTEQGGVFYYRIHSPVILIEFDHQRPANLRHLAKDPNQPNPQHIHCVVRTPNGNDYGKDLLRLHYAQSKHGD